MRLGHFREALADFSKAVELDAKHVLAWSNLGAIHAETAEWDRGRRLSQGVGA